MDYSRIAKYEYKAPSYELRERPEPGIDFAAHAEKRRYYYDAREGIYKSIAKEKDSVSMLFSGDLLCQEKMIQRYKTLDGGYDFTLCFEYIKPLLRSADFVAGNLETAISPTAPYRGEILSHEGPYFCNAPVQYLEALSDAGFDMLTTENNHTLDAGVRGVAETMENVRHFGVIQTGTSLTEEDKFVIVDICGFKVGFTAFGTKYNSMLENLTPEGKRIVPNTYSHERAERLYESMKEKGAEYIVCFPHWGNEYTNVLAKHQTEMAKSLAKIGYDLVLAAHPHVIQKFRLVDGMPVLFSMGNLMSHLNSSSAASAYTVLSYLELKRNSDKTILPKIKFIPCKILKNYKGIPFTVLPVNDGLALTERQEPKLKKVTQRVTEYLECKAFRTCTNFPVSDDSLKYLQKLEEELPERLDRLEPAVQSTGTAGTLDIPQKYFWDRFLSYHATKNCLYKIFPKHAESVQFTDAEIVVLPRSVEDVPVKIINNNLKKNGRTRLVYLGRYVETLGKEVFQNYSKLESIRMFSRLKTIEERAFANCTSLTGVILPRSMTTLGKEAFLNCSGLISVKIPPSVISIGKDAFKNCHKLTIYCEKGSVADRYAEMHNIPIMYMPLDPASIDKNGNDENPVIPVHPVVPSAPVFTQEPVQPVAVDVIMGPMNGPKDKHPAPIIAACYYLGKPLPASAQCGNQPSRYIGEKTLDRELITIKKLLGERMPETDEKELQKAHKMFSLVYKRQSNLIYTDTDFAVYFCDWILFAKPRGFTYNDYFDFELYNKEAAIRDTFLSDGPNGYRQHVYNLCSKHPARKAFKFKSQFNKTFAKYVSRDWVDGSTCSFHEFSEFAQNHDKFFVKPIGGTGGAGARIVDRNSDTLENLYDMCKREALIVEEIVKQHPDLALFNESTLNTVRINTLLCADGVVRVLSTVVRFGRTGNVVDNFHVGGMVAVVDIDTGMIVTDAINRSHLRNSHHPDSSKKFLGFQIPNWEDVKAAVCDASLMCPQVRHVGWDVAVTETGKVELIEGNCWPNFDVLQSPDQLGRRFRYETYIRELEELSGREYEELQPLVIDTTGMETDG